MNVMFIGTMCFPNLSLFTGGSRCHLGSVSHWRNPFFGTRKAPGPWDPWDAHPNTEASMAFRLLPALLAASGESCWPFLALLNDASKHGPPKNGGNPTSGNVFIIIYAKFPSFAPWFII